MSDLSTSKSKTLYPLLWLTFMSSDTCKEEVRETTWLSIHYKQSILLIGSYLRIVVTLGAVFVIVINSFGNQILLMHVVPAHKISNFSCRRMKWLTQEYWLSTKKCQTLSWSFHCFDWIMTFTTAFCVIGKPTIAYVLPMFLPFFPW